MYFLDVLQRFFFSFSGKDNVQALLVFKFFLHIDLLLILDICTFVYMEINKVMS